MNENVKIGVRSGILAAAIYSVIILFVALGTSSILFYALLAAPLVFFLFYSLGYALKAGYVRFLKPSSVYNAYDNPVDNFFRSEYDKVSGSFILSAVCFLPTLLFFILFSWIFLLCKRKRNKGW